MQEATLTIGEVAREAGIRTSAIRYYERVGVLPDPDRVGGQRRYGGETIRKLQAIEVAKRAGFTLKDVKLLLATEADGGPIHEPLRELAHRKLPEVDALIEQAQAMRRWLVTASGCGCDTLDVCALFDSGAGGSRTATRT
jgi:MerR family redox-sensitive transcriptional activator SoxR